MGAKEMADRLGIDASRVRRIANRYGIGQRVGQRTLSFTEGDIAKMQAHSTGKSGRPFAKTRIFSKLLSDRDWMDAIEPGELRAICTITDRDGGEVAEGELALRDGEPVVLVDDDAHTILTVEDLDRERYAVVVAMPGPSTEADANARRAAAVAERASTLYAYVIPVTYKIVSSG
jgi:hypothetical protein